eukprot:6178262-Pleurochrysis_carterae.AAC.5
MLLVGEHRQIVSACQMLVLDFCPQRGSATNRRWCASSATAASLRHYCIARRTLVDYGFAEMGS